jgi:hypothetical protein
MRARPSRCRSLGLALVLVLAGCGPSRGEGATNTSSSASAPSPIPTIQDVLQLPDFSPLEPGSYFMDPDSDPSTPLRVEYEIAADGWSQWIGAAKFAARGHVGVSIVTVTNVVSHGCRDHSRAVPPVGPSVDDLAEALADLAPFRVTSPPRDVNVYGYRGKHLELTVPDLPVSRGDNRRFVGCVGGKLNSWIAPPYGTYYGHTGPDYSEEFWILDVEGSRLVIVAERSPRMPDKDIAELRAILDSIRIEP